MVLNFRQLDIFVAVAELGSFTKAAKELYMTQPAISWQIKSLETALGLTLLERGDRNVTLTEAGKIFYIDAKRLGNLYDKLLEDMEEYKGLGRGSLLLGASTIPGEYLLPGYIGEFKNSYPEINISLSIGDTGFVVEKLLQDSIQLGVIGAQIEEKKLSLTPFLQDDLLLIAGPDHPWYNEGQVQLEDLASQAYVFREPGSGTQMVINQALKDQGVPSDDLNVVMELGSTRAVVTAVAAGLGLSWVSRWAVEETLTLEYVREVKVAGFAIERNFYLAFHRNRTLSPLTKTFIKFLLQGSGKSFEEVCQQLKN